MLCFSLTNNQGRKFTDIWGGGGVEGLEFSDWQRSSTIILLEGPNIDNINKCLVYNLTFIPFLRYSYFHDWFDEGNLFRTCLQSITVPVHFRANDTLLVVFLVRVFPMLNVDVQERTTNVNRAMEPYIQPLINKVSSVNTSVFSTLVRRILKLW